MSVIPITLFFSLLLAGTFVVLFAREQRRSRCTSAERDSLLPLAEEKARVVISGQVERDLRARPVPVQPVRHGPGGGGRPGSAVPLPAPDDGIYF